VNGAVQKTRAPWLQQMLAQQQQARGGGGQRPGALDKILGSNQQQDAAQLMGQTSPEWAFKMQDYRMNPMATWY
jgi:hypothetical protein